MLNDTDKAKLATLRSFAGVQIAEIVKVEWGAPTGTIYYAATQVDEIFPSLALSPVEAVLITDGGAALFHEIMVNGLLADETVALAFSDLDGAIADLFQLHGEGVRVEVFYFFPQVDLLLSIWHGHIRTEEDADEQTCNTSASAGFRSSQLNLPRRAFYSGCSAIYGALLPTQDLIDHNDCPYNRHIGGSTGLLDADGNPILSCPRNNRAACKARLGDDLSYLGFDTVIETHLVNETKGSNYISTTRGSESTLKRPLRVIAGKRTVRDCDVVAFAVEIDNKHPEGGAARVLAAIGEGRVRSITGCKVNGKTIGFEHLNTRRGERRQSRTSLGAQAANYSGTALFYAVTQGNFAGATSASFQCEAVVEGKDDVRVYTDANTFTEEYTNSRVWWLFECLRNQRWGLGVDENRFVIEDWIALEQWAQQQVGFTDSAGTHYQSQRTRFDAELSGRSAQQQIYDICAAGRFSLPFQHEGKDRIVPLAKVDDLSTCKVFADYGSEANIVRVGGKASLRRSVRSDATLANSITLTFDDEEHGNIERPLLFESEAQQLRAGRAYGDNSRRVIEASFSAFGVTQLGEAGRIGNLLLDLGEFDEGGIENNLRITFTTWFEEALELHKYKVIRVISHQLERYGFEYFRIRSLRHLADLQVEISAQAYPVAYYERLEDATLPPPITGAGSNDNTGGRRGDIPYRLAFQELTHGDDLIRFKIEF